MQLGNWSPHDRALHILDRSACGKFVGGVQAQPVNKRGRCTWDIGANMLGGPTLEASYHGGCGRGGVGDINGVSAGAGDSHNHFQSSGQSNTSRAHRRSSSSVNSRPTSLSRSSIPSVVFSGGKGVWSARREGICSSGQLGKRVDCSVSGGYRVGG